MASHMQGLGFLAPEVPGGPGTDTFSEPSLGSENSLKTASNFEIWNGLGPT